VLSGGWGEQWDGMWKACQSGEGLLSVCQMLGEETGGGRRGISPPANHQDTTSTDGNNDNSQQVDIMEDMIADDA